RRAGPESAPLRFQARLPAPLPFFSLLATRWPAWRASTAALIGCPEAADRPSEQPRPDAGIGPLTRIAQVAVPVSLPKLAPAIAHSRRQAAPPDQLPGGCPGKRSRPRAALPIAVRRQARDTRKLCDRGSE